MSYLQSIDYDLARQELEEQRSSKIEAENISKLNYFLEAALHFAEENKISQDVVFTELKTAFKLYYPKCEMHISQGYKFQKLDGESGILIRGEL